MNAFVFTNSQGREQAVRWSFVPEAVPTAVPAAELKTRDPDFLAREIGERVARAPQRWTLRVELANPGDVTADPSKAWPDNRRHVDLGTLTVQKIEPEADGPCRDINFDPTVLPAGIRPSDDPFPAARSAAYAVSYDRRSAEAQSHPRAGSGARP